MRVDVFSGWVELRDPELVPERLRRPVFQKSVAASSLVTEDDNLDSKAMEFFGEFNDLLAVAMIKEWSFDLPISVDGLLDLPSRAYDEIRKVVAPFIPKLVPNFEVDPDPKVITENSNE